MFLLLGIPSVTLNTIQLLTGYNYKKWRSQVDFYLAMNQNMDLCVTDKMPEELTDTSTKEDKNAHKAWWKANKMAKTVIRNTMSDTVRGSVEEPETAIEYLYTIQEMYRESDKAEAARLSRQFQETKYDGNVNVREHIMKLIDINAQLRELDMGNTDDYVVHTALHSLPISYSQLRTSYNAQKEKWSLKELIAICSVEEERIKKEREPSTSVNLIEKKKKYQKKLKPNKAIQKNTNSASTSAAKGDKPFRFKCYFCKKVGHMKKDCTGFKNWLVKKGKFSNSVFSLEVNLINVEPTSWWIDSGSPLHITNSLQGFKRKRVPRSDEVNLCVGNGMRVGVKAIGTLTLDLGLGKLLVLDNVYYVPSMRRNLVSASLLVKYGCRLVIDNNGITISKDSVQLGSGVIMNDYLQLNCSPAQQEILLVENTDTSSNTLTGVKRTKCDEKSAYLWHRRLGHISKERLKTLVKNNILNELDFSDLEDCVECFKGKMTNLRRKKTTCRSQTPLELIHTDICGPFRTQTICGNVYYITFIDDYSRYSYVYLLSEKSQALQAFQIYKAEVEKQLDKKIKTVRSDRGGEFYGRYTEAGQQKGPFALFLQEHGIKAQYTTPYNPQQNGVAERKNRTLLNMVRSMMCTTGLPRFLWGEALRTANYICNRTPSKAVEKTSFELWCGRKPSLHHCHVWGCPAEARIYNPKINKLDPKTVSCYFIGYPEKSKGYKLYSAKHSPRIFETHQVKFLNEKIHNAVFEDLSSEFQEIVLNDNAGTKEQENMEIDDSAMNDNTENINQENLQNNDEDMLVEQDQDELEHVPVEIGPVVPQNQAAKPNPQNPPVRRSNRAKRPKYGGEGSDYVVYLQETDHVEDDLAEDDDPVTFNQAIESSQSTKWKQAMEAEIDSMSQNEV